MKTKFDTLPATKKAQAAAAVARKGRGRPAGHAGGKSGDPDNYRQVTAWVRRDTHKAVKAALLAEDAGRDFGDLVEELLGKWLKLRS